MQVWTHSDKKLSKYMYGLLENFDAKVLSFGYVLKCDLKPHPLAWMLGSDIVECKLTLQGMVGASMDTF